ncbi:unnamed protein product [Caenorhabditis auriculariae]|uniref:Uncharacterized protein n=1 Tax=Caenorhabditis auriculariae TaxID=2777116 RepID=A0A8S1GSL2_9PELO|nr:unnamed protein product [Caenorhabditis auriculariae]
MARHGKGHGNHEHKEQEKQNHQNKAKNSHSNEKVAKTTEKPKKSSFVRRTVGFVFRTFYYLSLLLLGLSTVSIGYNCVEGGKHIANSKPLCADLTKLSQFTKPSDKFVNNVRDVYGTVLNTYRQRAAHSTKNARATVNDYYKKFTKSDIGAKVEKYFYKVHAFVVEHTLFIQRFVQKQWAEVNVWYNKAGYKYVESLKEGLTVAFYVVLEIVKDLLAYAQKTLSHLAIVLEKFFLTWSEKGFNAALKTIV